MKKAFLFSILVLFITTVILNAEDKAGRIIFYKGKVEFTTDNQNWNNVKLLQYLPEGACVRVSQNSEAALILKDRSQIRLKSGSLFCLKVAGSAPGSGGLKQGILNLKKGSLWFRNKRKTTKPLIETPVVTASIRGTEMVINVSENKNTEVVVLEGKVKCSNDKNNAIITRGEAAEVDSTEKIRLVKLLRPENKAQWLLLTPEIVGPNDKNLSGDDQKAVELANNAVKLLSLNKGKEALAEVEKAYKISQNRAAVNVAMATILQSFGKFNKAVKYANKALLLDKKSLPALFRDVELYMGLNRVEKAEYLLNSFKGNKEDFRYYLLQGYIDLVRLDPNSAIYNFKKSIMLKPDFSESYLGLGLAEYYSGDIKNGLKHMEYASLLNPLAAYPHYYLGKAIYGIGERKEAEIELKRATQLDSNDPTSYVYLSTIYTDTFKPTKGILALEKAIELNNNKLATRSRFLLDQDRAAKNISLSWSLSMMGLNEWAKYTGDKAVWDDPTNSSAYLFRASKAVAQKSIDAATLGDARRASLLQPVNANTYITYTNYQGLLELPEFNDGILIKGGTDKSFTTNGYIKGGKKKIAFYTEGTFNTTDGPKNRTGEWGENGLARFKYAINNKHELLFEGILGHTHDEDLSVWSYGKANAEDKIDRKNYWSIYTGYHWKQPNNNHLLISAQYNGSDGNWKYNQVTPYFLNKKFSNYYHRRTFRGEFLEILNILASHKISFGGAFEYSDKSNNNRVEWYINDKTATTTYQREYKAYIRDLWHITDSTILDYGIAYCEQDDFWISADRNYKDKKRWLPQVGIVQTLGKNEFRLAYFHEMQPNYLSGTIQPVEVSGFFTVTGVYPGTWTKFYGAGWDRTWNERNFTKVELTRDERRFPYYYSPNPYINTWWKEERDTTLKLVYETLLGKQFALSFNTTIREIKSRKARTRRTDKDFGIKLTWVHPTGIIAQGAFWFVDQDTGKGYNDNGDNFGILSFSIQKSFWDKKGLLYFKCENIGDREFKYLTFEPVESLQLPWQSSKIIVGVKFDF